MLKKTRHRWVLLVAVTLFFPLSVSAQFSAGAKLGVTQNQFTQPGTTVGFSAGGYVTYSALTFATFKLEPQYAQQGGARQSYYIDYSAFEGNVSAIGFYNPGVVMHTVEIPLLAELTLPEFNDETVIPRLIIGGSYSFMAKATESSTTRYFFNDGTPSIDVGYRQRNVTDDYARNQFSAIVGFGVLFKTDSRDFQFDIRYWQGFTQVNNIKYPDAIQSSSSSSSPSLGIPANGIGGNLYTSSLSINFSMTIFHF